jgi:2-keto-3-deoxy-L-rhamnonate aldolase RhmA
MIKNFKTRLRERKPLFGILLSLPSPEIVEIAADAGFDWLFLDMEHGLLGFSDVQRMVQAVAGRCPCLVRVSQNEPNIIAKALDTGAAGLIFPHINRTDEAEACVRAAQYPPQGARSVGIARAQGFGGRVQDSIETANGRIVLVAQAEHIEAARNIEDILAVAGIDAVFIGPYDLSASLDRPGRMSHPSVRDAIRKVRAGCAAHKIPCGIFVRNAGAAKKAAKAGDTLICVGTETTLLGDIARMVVRDVKTGA